MNKIINFFFETIRNVRKMMHISYTIYIKKFCNNINLIAFFRLKTIYFYNLLMETIYPVIF